MRSLIIIVGAILALGSALRDASQEEIDMIFEKLLEDEEVVLSGEQYLYRLETFTMNYLEGDPEDGVNIEMIYDEDELLKQNGAKLIPTLKSELEEELQKRGVDPFNIPTPPYFNPLDVNPAVSQGDCGNCYLHTFIAALEIAYFKSTGTKIKLSEQEMTDCYYNGCEGGDYRMVAKTMGILDKLSNKEEYGPYKAKQLTCRANTTPDSLLDIKVENYISVPGDVKKIQAAIVLYGSVMTCMSWSSDPRCKGMSKYRAGTVVNFPEVPGGCDHAVVIVGYTPDYWIVRNSHGKNWGEDGNFRIKKGINSCGIEEDMAVIVVSSRSGKKTLEKNGCPTDKPTLCKASHCCTASKGCKRPLSLLEELAATNKEEVEEEKRGRNGGRIPGERTKRDEEEEEEEEEERRRRGGADSVLGKREEEDERRVRKNGRGLNENSNPWIGGKLARLLLKRGMISEEDAMEYAERNEEQESEEQETVDLEVRCVDKMGSSCRTMKMRGFDVCGRFLQHCLAFCNKCDAAPAPVPEDKGEIQGECITPSIANGMVLNRGTMKTGEKLRVRCKSGYRLAGGDAECLIQDVFTNGLKDSRLLPECVQIGSEALVGNGTAYIGTKNMYRAAGGRVEMECDSWNADILRGIMAVSDKDLKELLIGNHNYCRNPGGVEKVPFCLGNSDGIGKIFYCFGHAGCDTCVGATDNYGSDYCGNPRNTAFCLFSDSNSAAKVATVQGNCAATCCKMAGC